MGVDNEGKPSKLGRYQHPHYQEGRQERQGDQKQYYHGRRWTKH